MTAKEKAKEDARAGVRMLKRAVLVYLAEHAEGVLSTTLRDDLELRSPNPRGGWSANLLWGVMNLLRTEGKVRTEKRGGRNINFLS